MDELEIRRIIFWGIYIECGYNLYIIYIITTIIVWTINCNIILYGHVWMCVHV